ncbi:MAG TPA: four helix bundle protein [Candidatus Eisenbacteria bacterium]|nr:four helix bundle protein [Candidatus Eisenbacteria bacterium]
MNFDHGKLDVYHAELEFISWATDLLAEIREVKGRVGEVCDQLDRAGLSALLNTAEGNGKRQRPTRAKFFDDARGSATECAACLDALVAKRLCNENRIQAGKDILVRIVSMLSKLVVKFEGTGDGASMLREDESEYRVERDNQEIEDEDDDEGRGR